MTNSSTADHLTERSRTELINIADDGVIKTLPHSIARVFRDLGYGSYIERNKPGHFGRSFGIVTFTLNQQGWIEVGRLRALASLHGATHGPDARVLGLDPLTTPARHNRWSWHPDTVGQRPALRFRRALPDHVREELVVVFDHSDLAKGCAAIHVDDLDHPLQTYAPTGRIRPWARQILNTQPRPSRNEATA